METWIADRRIVLSPDGSRVLAPDEPQTGIQLATVGSEVSEADCKRFGLGPFAAAAAQPEVLGAEAEQPEPPKRGPGRPRKEG